MDETRSALLYLRRHALEKLAAKKQAEYITLKIRSSSTVHGQVSGRSGKITAIDGCLA